MSGWRVPLATSENERGLRRKSVGAAPRDDQSSLCNPTRAEELFAPKNCSHRRTVRTVAVDSLACAASASASVSAPSVSSIGHVAHQLVLCDHDRGACPEAESAYHAQLAARDRACARPPRVRNRNQSCAPRGEGVCKDPWNNGIYFWSTSRYGSLREPQHTVCKTTTAHDLRTKESSLPAGLGFAPRRPQCTMDLRMSARRGGGNAGSIAAGGFYNCRRAPFSSGRSRSDPRSR